MLPFDIESLCMAGNWWLPVVSVIWRVHTALLLLITFLKKTKKKYVSYIMPDIRRSEMSPRGTFRLILLLLCNVFKIMYQAAVSEPVGWYFNLYNMCICKPVVGTKILYRVQIPRGMEGSAAMSPTFLTSEPHKTVCSFFFFFVMHLIA